MPDKKKRTAKTATAPPKSEQIQSLPAEQIQSLPAKGDESWRKWKVKPTLEPMRRTHPPEAEIGGRIAYCRGQLDNLSIDALSRYTKFFDTEGISRQSLIRYEGGALPGVRELRILCEVLWVPISWLVFGIEEGRSQADTMLRNALQRMLVEMKAIDLPLGVLDLPALAEQDQIEKRQRWIDQARQPQPR